MRGLSMRLLGPPHNMVLGSQSERPKEQGRSTWNSYDLASDVTECHFHPTLLAEVVQKFCLGSRGRGLDPPRDVKSVDITL